MFSKRPGLSDDSTGLFISYQIIGTAKVKRNKLIFFAIQYILSIY